MIVRELLATMGFKVDRQAIDGWEKAIERNKKLMGNLKSAAQSLGGVLASVAKVGAASMAGIAAAAVKVGGEFESLRASLKTVTGSSEAAASAFATIKKFAATTPFSVKEVTQAFIKLKSLGLDPSEAALKSYGNTASAMGFSLSQFIEAVADASNGEFERLREFGITAKSQGDDVAFTFQGVTTTVGKNAKEIEGYLRSIGDTKFGDAMTAQMDTVHGVFSNLGDAFESFLDQIAQNGLLAAIKEVGGELGILAADGSSLAKMLGGLLGQAVRDLWAAFKKLGPAFQEVVRALPKAIDLFGGIARAAAEIVSWMGKFASAVGGVDNAIVILLPAMAALKMAAIGAAGPWGILIAGMLAAIPAAMKVGGALGDLMADLDAVQLKIKDLDRTQERGGTRRMLEGAVNGAGVDSIVHTMSNEDLFAMNVQNADSQRAIENERAIRLSKGLHGSLVVGEAATQSHIMADAGGAYAEISANHRKRKELEQIRKASHNRLLRPSEKKRMRELQGELDTTVRAGSGSGKHKKGKKELSAAEILERDFGGVVKDTPGRDWARAPLGTTINRIDLKINAPVSISATQKDGESGDAFAQRVAEIAKTEISKTIRKGAEHFKGATVG